MHNQTEKLQNKGSFAIAFSVSWITLIVPKRVEPIPGWSKLQIVKAHLLEMLYKT